MRCTHPPALRRTMMLQWPRPPRIRATSSLFRKDRGSLYLRDSSVDKRRTGPGTNSTRSSCKRLPRRQSFVTLSWTAHTGHARSVVCRLSIVRAASAVRAFGRSTRQVSSSGIGKSPLQPLHLRQLICLTAVWARAAIRKRSNMSTSPRREISPGYNLHRRWRSW